MEFDKNLLESQLINLGHTPCVSNVEKSDKTFDQTQNSFYISEADNSKTKNFEVKIFKYI